MNDPSSTRGGSGEGSACNAGESASSVVIAPADAGDVPEMSELYADAFATNPAYCSIFLQPPGSAQSRRALAWLFQRRLLTLLAAGNIFLTARLPSGELVACAGTIAPNKKPGVLSLIYHGILWWPFLWGLPSLVRALLLDAKYFVGSTTDVAVPNEAVAPVKDDDLSWELSMMAARPRLQGKGYGSVVLGRLLQFLDGADDGISNRSSAPLCPCVKLYTQEERNLRFYEKHGFVLKSVGTVHVPGAEKYTNWTMVRGCTAKRSTALAQKLT